MAAQAIRGKPPTLWTSENLGRGLQIGACARRRWLHGDGGNFLQRKVDRSFFTVSVLVQIFMGSLYSNRLSRVKVYIEFRRKEVFGRAALEYDGHPVQCFSLPFTNRDPVYSRIPNRAVDVPRRPGCSRHSHPVAILTTVCLLATAKLPLGGVGKPSVMQQSERPDLPMRERSLVRWRLETALKAPEETSRAD